ncbi:polyisoprenoid-binding protein YceI [Paenibacillus sp. V4I3]|uniref:YceI family protein n=1 Tax=unclassified Paenibacillus TaxID=185978 RepID=UPI002781BE25|nr:MULTISPECIES: YceI family protein [unclassified Paenibacillus]MDQ0875747.1 polyisoprenoid-binding protein YceI [Paenibacillus sp. V4I3]MDQ0888183.1 polyisoprenoid-binding protein YceI [Paenibacillus sp. V4I9]
MKLKLTTLAVGAFVVIGGAYYAYDYYAGNHVTIREVIPVNSSSTQVSTAAAVNTGKLNGDWSIQPDSKVYFSVTTSKEKVNFEGSTVTGKWALNTAELAKMKAEAFVGIDSLQSGNSQRDGHIKGQQYLNAQTFPEAKFTLKSIDNFPKEWKEGEKVSFDMLGTLTIKNITKDVIFKTDAVYNQDVINLGGSTSVTFDDFGMKNPHTVVLDTENNVSITLSLVMGKKTTS